MPWARRRWAGSPNRSTWSSSALPLAAMAPISARINVVLPAPLRPMRPHISPSARSSEASRTIGTGPIATSSERTLSIGRPRQHRKVLLGSSDQQLHSGVAERLVRRAVGDQRAVVEREHSFGEAGNDLHVVL